MKKVMFTAFAVGLGLTASTWAQVPSYVPTNGLVGWWPFNGNANDESGNGNNGTVNGATLTTDRFGNAGKAYSFDGVDDLIEILNSSVFNVSSFSVSIWVNNDTSQSFIPSRYILNKGCVQAGVTSSLDMSFRLYYEDDGINQHFVYDTWCPTRNFVNGPMHDGQWKNIIMTYDGSEQRFYINGQLFSSSPQSGNLSINNHSLLVGTRSYGTSCSYNSFYSGIIDDIGFWNRTLDSVEISDLYSGNICYDYVTVTDTLVINTGITGYNPLTYMNTLKIWPNPSNDHITIDAGNLATMNGYSIKIEDAQGQQVFQNAVNQQQFYVDITTWGGNGLYFVRIIDPQGNTVDIKKIVLQ